MNMRVMLGMRPKPSWNCQQGGGLVFVNEVGRALTSFVVPAAHYIFDHVLSV